MVRPELRLRGRSASEEGEESLCDTVLCCILLSMRCVRLRCVWFCVFLLDLGSQALVYACVWCIVWVSTICLLGKWGLGSGLDLTILSCLCCVKSLLYCNVTAMWCAHQARVGVSYICNVHVMYSAGYFSQQYQATTHSKPIFCQKTINIDNIYHNQHTVIVVKSLQ